MLRTSHSRCPWRLRKCFLPGLRLRRHSLPGWHHQPPEAEIVGTGMSAPILSAPPRAASAETLIPPPTDPRLSAQTSKAVSQSHNGHRRLLRHPGVRFKFGAKTQAQLWIVVVQGLRKPVCIQTAIRYAHTPGQCIVRQKQQANTVSLGCIGFRFQAATVCASLTRHRPQSRGPPPAFPGRPP